MRRVRGFTLIELPVVIVVLAILATLIAPDIFRSVGDAKLATAKKQIETLATALESYRLDNGASPSTRQGLTALWRKPTVEPPSKWREPHDNAGISSWK